jgi:hypothetical protein
MDAMTGDAIALGLYAYVISVLYNAGMDDAASALMSQLGVPFDGGFVKLLEEVPLMASVDLRPPGRSVPKVEGYQ